MFSNEYDGENIDVETDKKYAFFRCNLQRLAALYEDMNLIGILAKTYLTKSILP